MVLRIRTVESKWIIPILIVLFWQPADAQQDCQLHRKEYKAIRSAFDGNPEVKALNISGDKIPAAGRFYPEDCVYAVNRSDSLVGYLLSTRAKGRFEYFDYSIVYSNDLVIMKLIVTAYRSTHGAAICRKKWLSQFEGYKGTVLRLGPDIDAISGGTISAGALVEDVQRCHVLMSEIRDSLERNALPCSENRNPVESLRYE